MTENITVRVDGEHFKYVCSLKQSEKTEQNLYGEVKHNNYKRLKRHSGYHFVGQ